MSGLHTICIEAAGTIGAIGAIGMAGLRAKGASHGMPTAVVSCDFSQKTPFWWDKGIFPGNLAYVII